MGQFNLLWVIGYKYGCMHEQIVYVIFWVEFIGYIRMASDSQV